MLPGQASPLPGAWFRHREGARDGFPRTTRRWRIAVVLPLFAVPAMAGVIACRGEIAGTPSRTAWRGGGMRVNPGSGLRGRNLRALFDLTDSDRDGFITEGDSMAVAGRLVEEFAVPDGPRRAAVQDAYRSLWERITADCDADGDGRVSREEFAAAYVHGDGQPAAYFQRHLGPFPAMLAQTIDEAGDGLIDAAQYVRAFAVPGWDDLSVLAVFQRLDADRDGKISADEFAAGNAHLYLSEDPRRPRNRAPGPDLTPSLT